MRIISAVVFALGLALGSAAAVAQESCSAAPLCPDDGAVPSGDLIPNCSCPAPNSCGEPSVYRCNLAPGFVGALEWQCECIPEPPPEPPPPGPPPDPGFCGGITCPDGSTALPEPPTPSSPSGGQCTCKTAPGEGICAGHCTDGAPPKVIDGQCTCVDILKECDGHICRNGKPVLVTTQGSCVCDDGNPAPLITEPPPD